MCGAKWDKDMYTVCKRGREGVGEREGGRERERERERERDLSHNAMFANIFHPQLSYL